MGDQVGFAMTRPAGISGLVVTARPGCLDAARRAIEALPGLEVHGEDATSCKLIVVQDLPTLDDHVEGLRRVQALPEVLTAELVCHVDESAAAEAETDLGTKRGRT